MTLRSLRPLDCSIRMILCAHRPPGLVGDPDHRRRAAVHRQGDRRVLRARHRQWQAGLAVPDRLRHQRPADHLHPQRQAVRQHLVRHRRPVVERCTRAAQGQSPTGWLGLDLRTDRLICAACSDGRRPLWGGGLSARAEAGRHVGPDQGRRGTLRDQLLACYDVRLDGTEMAFDLRKFPPGQRERFVTSVTRGKNQPTTYLPY